MVEKINAVNRVRRELEYGRESAVGLDEIAERLSLSAEAVGRIINSDMQVMSLEECGADREIHTPDALSIVDLAPDPLQYACDRSLTAAIEGMLADFDKRDRKVLVLRYGFDGLDTMTLEEVGQQFNVTRERIRQIEAKALRKLRHRSRSDVLLPYAATSLHPAVATQDKT
jgi:RNA polymerase primary sigma factor